MILVEEWIKESRDNRTAHLDMSEPCIERGGNSTVHRGVLAQYLDTNVPNKIDLCHNCGNGKCSNPNICIGEPEKRTLKMLYDMEHGLIGGID